MVARWESVYLPHGWPGIDYRTVHYRPAIGIWAQVFKPPKQILNPRRGMLANTISSEKGEFLCLVIGLYDLAPTPRSGYKAPKSSMPVYQNSVIQHLNRVDIDLF